MVFDPTYFIFVGPAFLLAWWAQRRVKGQFDKYSKVRTARNMTGAQIARALLDAYGLQNVKVERVPGQLTDHYDPRGKVLRLSEVVYDSPSVAAAGVAAHEMGHALQDAQSYGPLRIRSALVPATNFGSRLGPWIFMGGIFFGITQLAWVGVALFGATAAFSLITLPVEFDASARAKKLLHAEGLMFPNEIEGVDKVLDAAALTYVASAAQAVLTLLYFITRLNRR